MEEKRPKFDIVVIVTMTIVALIGDLFSFFALLVAPLPVIGEVVFAGALVFDFLISGVLCAIFVWKKERSPAIWSILIPGLATGEVLPIKFVVVALTTSLSNVLDKHAWIKMAADAVATGGTSAGTATGEATALGAEGAAAGAEAGGVRTGGKVSAQGARGATTEADRTGGVNLEEPAQAFERIGLAPDEEPYGITPEEEPEISIRERTQEAQELLASQREENKEGENTFQEARDEEDGLAEAA